ncbi:MAG: hypothetical protein ACOYN0_15345 [Phycisphaerales bacterium]
MSAVCVITPIVIGAWPGIVVAAIGAAQTLGLTVVSSRLAEKLNIDGSVGERNRVSIEVENSEVIAEHLATEQEILLSTKDGVLLRVRRDERGMLSVCAEGEGVSKATLREVGETLAGRIVQQFAYNHLMTELAARNFEVVDNKLEKDDSIRVRVRSMN